MKLLLLLLTLLISCSDSEQIRREAKIEIIGLHNAQRDYHFNKNAHEFAKLLGKNHISVNRGRVRQSGIEENKKRLVNYFSSVEFIKWDDTAEPIIRFSDDNRMAYTIVQKEVIVRYQNESEQLFESTTHFSWLAIYKSYPEGWKIDAVGSTNLASIEKIIN